MSMQVERWERYFLYAAVAVLVAFFIAILASIGEAGIHLPTDEAQVDPNVVVTQAPFDNPGLFETGDNQYEAVMVARMWQWTPSEIVVPEGAEVTFTITSPDVIHGFLVNNTAINAMVIPGQITRVTQTFDEPGEYKFVCHEFCGLANEQVGHHSMFGKVVVE